MIYGNKKNHSKILFPFPKKDFEGSAGKKETVRQPNLGNGDLCTGTAAVFYGADSRRKRLAVSS